MANKGPIEGTIDASALTDIIIFAKTFKRELGERAAIITAKCTEMTTSDALNGGDGEELKDIFRSIAAGIQRIEATAKIIADVLDDKLGKALEMGKGKYSSAAMENTTAAAQKMGSLTKE